MSSPNVQTKYVSAEGAITLIKEPLAAKMPALKRAKCSTVLEAKTVI